MDKILEVEQLQKKFGNFQALKNVSFTLSKGEILGFIGPNGAGKSTTIRILLGILKKSGGRAQLFGKEVFKESQYINRSIAYVPGDVYLWKNLTGGELIDYLLRLRGVKHSREKNRLIELFEFDPTKKAATYSKGNRQKVALITALATDAGLYIFDEPTSGLDPLNELRFQEELLRLKERGKSILLSSHILSEVEKLADKVAIIKKGTIIKYGSIADMSSFALSHVTLKTESPFEGLKMLQTMRHLEKHENTSYAFTIDNDEISTLVHLLSKERIVHFEITRPKLEELFMEYYGEVENRHE